MGIEIVIGICASTFTVIGSILAMMFWCRSEANGLRTEGNVLRAEGNDLKAEANALRKEFVDAVNQMKDLIRDIQLENKDFHYRLLEIERSRKVIIRSHE